MELNQAIAKIGDLQEEIARLRTHKERLEADVKDARDKKSAAEEQVAELKKQLPGEDSTVLSKADADRWEAYRSLGKPDDLKATLEAKTQAEGRLAELERQDAIRNAAGSTYNAKALTRFLPTAARIEASEETRDGKTEKAYAVILPQGEGQEPKRTPLREWVEMQEQELGLSLKADQPKPAPTGAGRTPERELTPEDRRKDLEGTVSF